MSRPLLIRALIALAVLATSGYFVVTSPIKLGLDLRGGTQFVLEARDGPTVEANAESTDRALEVLRRRVDALGVTEPTLARSGERRIIIELPGVQDPREAAKVIGQTAQLTFHPVTGIAQQQPNSGGEGQGEGNQGGGEQSSDDTGQSGDEQSQAGEADGRVLPDKSGTRLQLAPPALTGEGVSGADASLSPEGVGGWFVTVDFRGQAAKSWQQLTGEAACAPPGDPTRRVAIVLDNEIISSPQVDPSVSCGVGIPGGSTQITGNFNQQSATQLATLIEGGALPVPVEIIEQRTIGPTLGDAAIDASWKAAVAGVAATILYIAMVYRLVGGLAALALASYGLISFAALVALGATLTLPGLAGFVLAIGMAVDANVLVFERAREEHESSGHRRSLRGSVIAGFKNAWSAILDSNVTTLLAAVLLFFLATGPVRGFGVTLTIGVLASMVSALIIGRVLVESTTTVPAVRRHPAVTGLTSLGRVRTWLAQRNPNLMRHSRRWLAASAIAVVLAGAGIGIRGLELGVEFTGGRVIEYSTSRQIEDTTARQIVADAGFPRAVVQESGNNNLTVRTNDLSNAEQVQIRRALSQAGGEVTKVSDQMIGPSLGDELRQKALIALGVALAAQLLYLALRFRWTFGAAAVTAMAHDVLILLGIFAWLGKPIDGVFLAALLTVIGYSVNDSVVIFDRVREHWGNNRRTPFPSVTNTAILQTVPRTINTGLGAIFILTALALFGAGSLTDFALALLIGVGVGTYSSMFTASPLAIELERRSNLPPPGPKYDPGRLGARTARRDRSGRPVRDDNGAVV